MAKYAQNAVLVSVAVARCRYTRAVAANDVVNGFAGLSGGGKV